MTAAVSPPALPPRLPLASRNVYRTGDPEVATREGTRLFAEHRLEVLGRPREFDAVANVADLSGLSVNFVRFGAPVQIVRVPTQNYVGLIIPLSGSIALRHQGVRTVVGAREAAVFGGGPLQMEWTSDCQILSISLPPARLTDYLERLLPDEAAGPVLFDSPHVAARDVAPMLGLVRLTADTFERTAESPGGPPRAVVSQLRDMLMSALLLAVPHNYSAAVYRPAQRPARRSVRQAIDLIEAEEQADLTVREVAAQVGVGLRALEAGFQAELRVTPLHYLRTSRLQRAHHELLAAEPGQGRRVADIAQKWGFNHTGRFSRLYWEQFGVYPSATLMATQR